MEAGDYVPNTAVALRLARALETSVEELFEIEEAQPPARREVQAKLIGSRGAHAGTPVELCRVDRQLVAVPAAPAMQQLLPADGVLADSRRSTVQLLGDEALEPRLLVAGCDPATSVLRKHLQKSGVGLVAASVNSTRALELLSLGLAHVAGTHLPESGPGSRPRPRGFAAFTFAVWEEGLVVAHGNPKGIRAVADLAASRVAFVNREPGSGSRQLLDKELKTAGVLPEQVRGYGDCAFGHLPAAWRVYAGLADCCVATRAAARAFGLDFLPLTSERYDFVLREKHLEHASVQRLLELLVQSAFRRELGALCGYDTRDTGRRITASR
jgi:molybdate-binding protein